MRYALLNILLIMSIATADAVTIKVRTQQDFDLLGSKIMKAIKDGERNISVNIEAKELTFINNQISLTGIKHDDVIISIYGNGVHIKSQGEFVREVTNHDFMYLKDGEYYNPWTEFEQLQDTITITDEASHLCSIYTTSKNKKDPYPQNKCIHYTCWYTSRKSPITYIGKNRIEFDGGDWAVPQKGNFFNVNMDYSYAKIFPRYRLFGTKEITDSLYECTASTLLKMSSCNIQNFHMDDINVTGSSSKGALIYVYMCDADAIVISNCSFRNIGGGVLYDRKSTNVCFKENKVDTFMNYGIKSDEGSTGASVIGNTFSNCTLGMEMSFAILMRSEKFAIKHNTISDFCYGGIGVGIWGGAKTTNKCSGVITDNELFYTDAFLSDLMQHTLMDSGAIYVWTNTDGVTINNNYIHDIAGIKDNRGIFCDDGTKNVTITNNRIENIDNSYDIDLRWCETYKSNIPDHNTGNKIFNNQTTGKIRFENSKPTPTRQ